MSKSYVLKVVRSDMTTRDGFKWGGVGETTVVPDWEPTAECGNGLHGWLNGVGDISCQSISETEGALWLALEVDTVDIIDLSEKVKFPRALTLFVGSMSEAAAIVAEKANEQGPVIGITRSGGDRSTNTGGYRSTNMGGDYSTNTGGYRSTNMGGVGSTNTGGDRSTNMGGDYSTNTGGDYSTNTGGHGSTVSGGDYSTNTGGYRSTNMGGDRSTNTGGDRSTNMGGDYSTNTGGHGSTVSGGHGSTVSGGHGSILQIAYYDTRKRIAMAYVGENGIKPNTFYRLNSSYEFEEVTQ